VGARIPAGFDVLRLAFLLRNAHRKTIASSNKENRARKPGTDEICPDPNLLIPWQTGTWTDPSVPSLLTRFSLFSATSPERLEKTYCFFCRSTSALNSLSFVSIYF